MRKPVCLITPPSAFLLDERVFMSLGILKVGAVLERAGFTVEVLDLSGVSNFEEVARLHAKNSDAKIFGITSTTPQLPSARKIAESIKSVRDDARLILGGPHVTLTSVARKNEVKRGIQSRAHEAMVVLEKHFDVLVAGDGEEAILRAVVENPPKLIDADDPNSDLFLRAGNLETYPFPARHLIDVDSYKYKIDGERALSLIAQLGCPFPCGFCGGRLSPSFRRARIRSAENVIAEMVHLHKEYGVKGMMLYDDELNVNQGMLPLMCGIQDVQSELGVSWRLRGFVKSQLLTDEQAKAMYDAGFRWILVGFESGSPCILKNMNKRATREENTRCMEIARRHGLKVKALLSIGHPGESGETIRATEDWLLKVAPDDFDVSIITTYPGTPYYDFALPHSSKPGIWVYTSNGDNLYSVDVDFSTEAEYYKGKPDGGYKSFVYTDYLTRDELVAMRDSLERNVRHILNIPYNTSSLAIRYEHSMGQTGPLPSNILRQSAGVLIKKAL
ncbi:MAG: hypothetical protein COU07_03315 [Candidatus Harrisonbacteria bacterium CG10_big_fil_rev_8_21_14_0_10_40_38]|uniref:Uncharacterized protein n=1 Tax=Candidatus Harrisonbacteria bacterium CG10_big_fil_rev_8_21_14_0_10_40_38 TaxID=1974583 RepID=A0A2H0UR78_9BACT|nr:MAG: hypothetical protein COU07_03315 [Candidatus Harrisonbacteria bacterium CG10_big_fil_rev_8_21_14_0_10_40_38]